jgi:hypothetical protein
MHGGNAALHDITFVTYESIVYVATVVSDSLSMRICTYGCGDS